MPMQRMDWSVRGRNPFNVIKFIDLPNESTPEYVIVPESWIISFCFGRTSTVREVKVAYPPQESSESTQARVMARERPRKEWRDYTGIIEFKADSYTDAVAWSTIKNLNFPFMVLDYDHTGDNPPIAALESSGSRQNSLSSSNASDLQMQVPAVDINPSTADEGFRKLQPIKAEAAEYFDDSALSSIADNCNPIIIEIVQNIADYADLSPSEDEHELIIAEEDQNSQTRKKTANSDEMNGPETRTVPEIPYMSNLSCNLFEPSGKKPLSSGNLGQQGRMSNSTTARPPAAPPRGHLQLHLSTSSAPVNQDHLAIGQDITENKQPSVENDSDLSLFSSSYQKTSVPLFGRSDNSSSVMSNGNGTPSNAKHPSNFSNDFSSSQLPSLQLPTATDHKHGSLGTQQTINQRDTANNENMKINNQNLHPQQKNKKPTRVPVTNPTDQYYGVQFKNAANLQAKYMGIPHKRAATSTADEVPPKRRSMTVNAAESAQLPDISALKIKSNTQFGENCHHQVKHSQISAQDQVPQSHQVSAPQFPPQTQTGYSSLPRFPAQNIHTGFAHQYPSDYGQPAHHIQAHQSSSTHEAFKQLNPVNSTNPYIQQNLQNTMCLQSYNLTTQKIPGHHYLPDQPGFSNNNNGQIVTYTNMQISTRNINEYQTSHRPLMGPSNAYNGNYSTMASHDTRRGVTSTAGLTRESEERHPRLRPRGSEDSVQQHFNNLAPRYTPQYPADQARPIAADNQPHRERGADRNIAFQEFKQQRFNEFHKKANAYTTQYIGAMLQATTQLCPQGAAAWDVIIHEFKQRFEAFRKKAHEYSEHYVVAIINQTTDLCNDINGYFIR